MKGKSLLMRSRSAERRLPLDHGGAKAVMSPEPGGKTWTHKVGSLCRTGPSQVRLEPSVSGRQVTVQVPPFRYYQMIVFRLGE